MPLRRRVRRLQRKKRVNHTHHHHNDKVMPQYYNNFSTNVTDTNGMYDEDMKQQIWYYILRKYFYEQMFGSQTKSEPTIVSQANSGQIYGAKAKSEQTFGPRTISEQTFGSQTISEQTFGSQTISKQTFASQTKSEQTIGSQLKSEQILDELAMNNETPFPKESEMTVNNASSYRSEPKRPMSRTKRPKSKISIDKKNYEIPEFMKSINIQSESSSSNTDQSDDKIPQNPLTKDTSFSKKSLNSSSLESTTSTTPAKLANREKYLSKLSLYKRLKEENEKKIVKTDGDDDDDDDDDEESEEESSTDDVLQNTFCSKKEPSWDAVVQMMDNFSLMRGMFAQGKKLF
ncbi:hypothetical protein O3M35_004906 [Rhynocoris fuscipes]|uniref:Uncharacterized protein n=1 Tax=Rhynocoris fuscipes TaxID=488301 RepID=A0AAW1DLK6_9HEMI